MSLKKLVASDVGLPVADVVSAAKIRFAQWWGESFYLTSMVRGIMKNSKISKIQSFLLTLTLIVAAFWVSPAVGAEKKMVKDPTTGKMVTAPEYGGTITISLKAEQNHSDVVAHVAGYMGLSSLFGGVVLEPLAFIGDWGEFFRNSPCVPMATMVP